MIIVYIALVAFTIFLILLVGAILAIYTAAAVMERGRNNG